MAPSAAQGVARVEVNALHRRSTMRRSNPGRRGPQFAVFFDLGSESLIEDLELFEIPVQIVAAFLGHAIAAATNLFNNLVHLGHVATSPPINSSGVTRAGIGSPSRVFTRRI